MGYEIVRNPVEVRDLHATMLYLLGFDYRKLELSLSGPGSEAHGREARAHRVRNPGIADGQRSWIIILEGALS